MARDVADEEEEDELAPEVKRVLSFREVDEGLPSRRGVLAKRKASVVGERGYIEQEESTRRETVS
jgi:hypothetical protein